MNAAVPSGHGRGEAPRRLPAWQIEPRKIRTLALWCASLLALATAVAQFVDYRVYDLRYRTLDSNTHASIFGAISLLASGIAVIAAILLAERRRTTSSILLCVGLVALVGLRVARPGAVVALSVPFDCLVLVILWREGANGSRPEGWLLRAGCVLLILSFAVHVAELHAFPYGRFSIHSWAYQARCVVKHDAELAAWVLIAAGLLCAWREPEHPTPPP